MKSSIVNFIIMLLLMFVIGYLTMSVLIDKNILFSLNKVYAAFYMMLWMGAASAFLELAMPGMNTDNEKAGWGITAGSFTVAAILFSFIIKQQIFIDESQFLRSMIEHHEMAVVMATKLLEKQNVSAASQKLAQNIISTQTAEIEQMQKNKVIF